MKWTLVIASRAKRQLRRLSKPSRDQISAAFVQMCDDPFRGDVKFLRDSDGAARRRVGHWRILYVLHMADKVILVIAIKRRSSNTY